MHFIDVSHDWLHHQRLKKYITLFMDNIITISWLKEISFCLMPCKRMRKRNTFPEVLCWWWLERKRIREKPQKWLFKAALNNNNKLKIYFNNPQNHIHQSFISVASVVFLLGSCCSNCSQLDSILVLRLKWISDCVVWTWNELKNEKMKKKIIPEMK